LTSVAQEAINHVYFDGLREKDENRPITAKLEAARSKPSLRPSNNIPAHPLVPTIPVQGPSYNPTLGKGRNVAKKPDCDELRAMHQSPGSVEKGRSSSKFERGEKDSRLPQPSLLFSIHRL
jgi:hypothetical protein